MADTPSFHSDDEATVGRFARLTVQNGMKVSKSASKILHELGGRPATVGPFLQVVLRGVSRLVSVVEDPANVQGSCETYSNFVEAALRIYQCFTEAAALTGREIMPGTGAAVVIELVHNRVNNLRKEIEACAQLRPLEKLRKRGEIKISVERCTSELDQSLEVMPVQITSALVLGFDHGTTQSFAAPSETALPSSTTATAGPHKSSNADHPSRERFQDSIRQSLQQVSTAVEIEMESVMVVERAETEQDNAEGQARTTDQQALRALVTQNQKRLLRYRKGLQDLSLHYHSESSNGMLSDDGEDNSYVEKGTDPALSASKLLIDICAESQPLTGDWALKKLRKLAGLLDEMDQSKHAITVLHIVAALYRSRNTEADRNQLCRALLYLSSLLLSLARREEALTASEEAVTIVETMAELESERYKAHLAAALKMKSICKSDIGDADSAIKAAERAVSIYRYLHTNRPADFETALAGMLMEYSIILSKDRQKEGALQANEECLRMYRSMHTKRSTELEAELAEALCSYSIRLSEFGRIIEALQAIEESIAMQQVLDEMQPGHFTVHLAWGFTHYSTQLFKANRYEDGMEALEESLSMRRFLSQERPSRFLADLAWTLASYSMRLDKLGRRKDALEAIEESLKIRRTLLAARPEISCADLAWTLGMYSTILSKVRRHGEALAAIAECLRIRRSLHLRQPAAFEANLASTTFSYSSHLARAGRVEEAMRACEESLMLYETLYEARPQVHELDLANTRSHHATLLKRLRGNGGPYWRREEPSS